MVGNFVRLKFRLLANRLRTGSVMGTVGFVLLWVASVVGGVLGGLAVWGLGRLTEEPGIVLMLAYTVLFVVWAVFPAMTSALDDTLDPRRFELLPLQPGRLVAGLLVAGAAGPGGVATLLGLLIGTIASFPVWSLLPVLLLAIAVELLLCLVVARLVTSVLSNLLASRRSREFATLVFGLGMAALFVIPSFFAPQPDEEPQIDITVSSVEPFEALAWAPPGAVARSISLVSDGELAAGIGLLAYGIATILVLGWAWAGAVRRMLVTAPISGRQGRRVQRSDRDLRLIPSWLSLAPGPVSGVVSKEFRYLLRDNRVRAQIMGSLFAVVVIGFVAEGPFADSEYAPFVGAAAAFFIAIGILANQFGHDGGSFWGYVATPTPLTEVMKGKNVGWGLVIVPLCVVLAAAVAILNRGFAYLVAACLATVAVVLITMATGNVASIYGAYRISESNPFGSRMPSGAVFVAVLGSVMVSGVLVVPIGLLVGLPALTLGPAAATVGASAAIGYGYVMYRVGLRVSGPLLIERQQSLLDVLDTEGD